MPHVMKQQVITEWKRTINTITLEVAWKYLFKLKMLILWLTNSNP